MARRPMTPARRKRRTIRMAIALPILLAVLVLVLDYPILTAGQALRATQKRYFFGPGEVLTSSTFHAATISSKSVSPTATTSCGGGTGMPGAV